MSLGLLTSVAMGVAVAGWVFSPLFARDASEQEQARSATGERADLFSRKEMVMASLKDLEDDRETDKISEHDYMQLKNKLTAQAIEIMKKLDDEHAPQQP
jgi:hypothetical protein